MTFKRPLPVIPNLSSSDTSQTESDHKNFCKVCGDKAHYNNYGTLCCSSCKVFFRRHGFHAEVCIIY
jgi:hypothetical protein